MEYPQFKVCVRCFTYNQSEYIEDALNGFVMQLTDFPFVCCIVDDASTDGEQDVIKKYVEENFDLAEGSCNFERETDYAYITYAQHKSNKNCYFAVLYLKENHYSTRKTKMPYLAEWRDMCEYEALCEGDDYWTDSRILQKQTCFLDTHSAYSAIANNAQQISEKGIHLGPFSTKESRDLTNMGELVRQRQFHTAAILYRRSAMASSPLKTVKTSWDTLQWCCLLSQGPICYVNEESCVYRIGTGVTSTTAKIKWVLIQEEWENILFNLFSPKYITYNDAYKPLLCDAFAVLLNENCSVEDKKVLKSIIKHYITVSLFFELVPLLLALLKTQLFKTIK